MENLFAVLGIIIIVATLLSLLSRLFKQPLILAYIAAGLALGPLFLNVLTPSDTLSTFAQIGVAFLLFIVGMNLNLKVFKDIGILSLVLGSIQVLLTILIGFFLVRALGFAIIPALYLSVALSFSSTIVVVKLLSDKATLDTFAGRITLGILIVQDLIAIIALILLTGLQQDTLTDGIFFTLLKGLILFILVYAASKLLHPILFKFVAHSQEQLFLTSIAWCFLLAVGASFLGFTIEIGAFLAGISLTLLPYHYEISSKVTQLRDFFLVIFFVNLGLQTGFASFRTLLIPAMLLSLFVLLIKPLIIMILLSILGYRKHTTFFVGSALAQISEFSLILLTLGVANHHLSSVALSLLTLVGIITITLSSYLIIYNDYLYKLFEHALNIFEKKHPTPETTARPKHYDTILFGCYRLGSQILDYLQQTNKTTLVVDFNPNVIKRLERNHIPYLYGDMSDHNLLERLRLHKVKIILSTVPNLHDTKTLLRYARRINKKATIIVTANHPTEAVELYHEGASYVITPHLLSAELVVEALKKIVEGKKPLKPLRIKHLKNLTRFASY